MHLIKHVGEEFVASLQNAEGVQWLPVRRTVRSMQEVKRGAPDKAILTSQGVVLLEVLASNTKPNLSS